MEHDFCPHCGRKQKHDRKFEWLVILSFIILIGALFRVLLFGGG